MKLIKKTGMKKIGKDSLTSICYPSRKSEMRGLSPTSLRQSTLGVDFLGRTV